MPSAQPASGSEPRLEPNDPSWRDRLRWALQDGLTGMGMKQGLAQMYGDHLVGSPMGGGVAAADLVPGIGQGLSANEASRSYDRGDLAGALLHGIGALPLGTMAAGAKTAVRAATREIAPELAGVRAQAYTDMLAPPKVEPRPFSADYPAERFPHGVRVGGSEADILAGRAVPLQQTIDGDGLKAAFVAGRRTYGGPDVPLSPEDLYDIGRRILPRGVEADPHDILRSNKLTGGYVPTTPATIERDLAGRVFVDPELNQVRSTARPFSDRDNVTAHELGHALDEPAGYEPGTLFQDGNPAVRVQAENVYRDLRSSHKLPTDYNPPYKPDQVPYELTAESVRAYMQDPNYVKSVAPDLATAIRQHMNGMYPDVIQFNSVAPIAAGGGAAALAAPSIADLYGPKQQ